MRTLIGNYISYYHADRIHDSLEKDAAAIRPVSSKPSQSAHVVSYPRIGALHHRYDRQRPPEEASSLMQSPVDFRTVRFLILPRRHQAAPLQTSVLGVPTLQHPGDLPIPFIPISGGQAFDDAQVLALGNHSILVDTALTLRNG